MKKRYTYRGNYYKVDDEIDYPETKKALIYGGFIGVPIALMGIFLLSTVSVFEGVDGAVAFFTLLGIAITITGPVLAYMFYSHNKELWDSIRSDRLEREEEERAFKEAHPFHEQEDFYYMCINEGIEDVIQRGNIERLGLLAKNENISGTIEELIEMYKIGEKAVLEEERAELIESLEEEEKKIDAKNKEYINFYGVEKLKKYCEKKIKENELILYQCERNEESVRNGGNIIYDTSKQRETDWAIAGGIASGLGGIGAGFSAAMEAQARNAEVRANNQNLARSIAQVQVVALQQIWETKRVAKSDLEYWTEKMNNTKMILVEKLPQDILLKELNPTVKEITVSESGAVRLKLRYDRPKTLKIFDNVPAYVDGSFKAVLKVNGEVAGFAYATLPYDGSDGYSTIEAVCRKVSIPAEKYDVSFEANNLWAMERK